MRKLIGVVIAGVAFAAFAGSGKVSHKVEGNVVAAAPVKAEAKPAAAAATDAGTPAVDAGTPARPAPAKK